MNSMKDIINKNLDSKAFVNLIASLGDKLNSPKDRFMKSDFIEMAFDVFSNGAFKWVDEVGRDHRYNNIDLEFKYSANCLFKRNGLIGTLKIKNSLGKNKGVQIDNPADYYVICSSNAMVVISFEKMKPYLNAVADGIEAKGIPQSICDLVYDNRNQEITKIDFDYEKAKMNMIRNVLNQL